MSFRRHSIQFVIKRALLLAAVLGVPAWIRGEEPLEMVSEAFRASQGLISGIGKGIYRHYRTIGQGDWHLDRDADISTYFDSNKYHIFECSRRFGFNLTRSQLFNTGQPKPKRDVRLEWKQIPNGPWYVRSLDDMRVVHDAKVGIMRVRDVLKYTKFEPNAKVDARRFMEAALADRLSR